jgi:hypothetical protein
VSAYSFTIAAIDNTLLFDAAAYALRGESFQGVPLEVIDPSCRPGPTAKASFFELLHTLLVYDYVELGYGTSGLYRLRSSERLGYFVLNLILNYGEVIRSANDRHSCFSYGDGVYPDHLDLRPVLDFVASSVNADIELRLRRLTLPFNYADSTQAHADYLISEWSAPSVIIPALTFAARGVAYVATVLGSNESDQHGCRRFYLAAPSRLEAMEPFLTATSLKEQARLRTGYLALLRSLRSLPLSGFDFSVLKLGSSAHLLTPLSAILSGQSPNEAIATVMRLRNTDAGETLRQEWRRHIYSTPGVSVVGQASQSIVDCNVTGDIIQTIHVHSADGA